MLAGNRLALADSGRNLKRRNAPWSTVRPTQSGLGEFATWLRFLADEERQITDGHPAGQEHFPRIVSAAREKPDPRTNPQHAALLRMHWLRRSGNLCCGERNDASASATRHSPAWAAEFPAEIAASATHEAARRVRILAKYRLVHLDGLFVVQLLLHEELSGRVHQ